MQVTASSSAGPLTGDVLVRIRGVRASLKPAEQRVAAVVLADPARAAQLVIGALADAADTSVATVTRFCRAVGVASYPQLRLALAGAAAREETRPGTTDALTDIGPDDSLADIVEKIVTTEARAVEDTGGQLDLDALAAAAAAIASARRIDIVGSGASAVVGWDLHQKLHRIGLPAFVWPDPHSALTATAQLGGRDVAIGISHSGTTASTLGPLRAAGDRGSRTVAITNAARSPLATTADLVLTAAARETPLRAGATASRIAQMVVVDCLFAAVVQSSYDRFTTTMTNTYDAVREGTGHVGRPRAAPRGRGDRSRR